MPWCLVKDSTVRWPNDEAFSVFTPGTISDRDRPSLQRFFANVRFTTTHKNKNGSVSDKPQGLKKISNLSAANYRFSLSDGNETTVAQYFQSLGVRLQYPNYVCIEVCVFSDVLCA